MGDTSDVLDGSQLRRRQRQPGREDDMHMSAPTFDGIALGDLFSDSNNVVGAGVGTGAGTGTGTDTDTAKGANADMDADTLHTLALEGGDADTASAISAEAARKRRDHRLAQTTMVRACARRCRRGNAQCSRCVRVAMRARCFRPSMQKKRSDEDLDADAAAASSTGLGAQAGPMGYHIETWASTRACARVCRTTPDALAMRCLRLREWYVRSADWFSDHALPSTERPTARLVVARTWALAACLGVLFILAACAMPGTDSHVWGAGAEPTTGGVADEGLEGKVVNKVETTAEFIHDAKSKEALAFRQGVLGAKSPWFRVTHVMVANLGVEDTGVAPKTRNVLYMVPPYAPTVPVARGASKESLFAMSLNFDIDTLMQNVQNALEPLADPPVCFTGPHIGLDAKVVFILASTQDMPMMAVDRPVATAHGTRYLLGAANPVLTTLPGRKVDIRIADMMCTPSAAAGLPYHSVDEVVRLDFQDLTTLKPRSLVFVDDMSALVQHCMSVLFHNPCRGAPSA